MDEMTKIAQHSITESVNEVKRISAGNDINGQTRPPLQRPETRRQAENNKPLRSK